jgi:hypothetical protein
LVKPDSTLDGGDLGAPVEEVLVDDNNSGSYKINYRYLCIIGLVVVVSAAIVGDVVINGADGVVVPLFNSVKGYFFDGGPLDLPGEDLVVSSAQGAVEALQRGIVPVTEGQIRDVLMSQAFLTENRSVVRELYASVQTGAPRSPAVQAMLPILNPHLLNIGTLTEALLRHNASGTVPLYLPQSVFSNFTREDVRLFVSICSRRAPEVELPDYLGFTNSLFRTPVC